MAFSSKSQALTTDKIARGLYSRDRALWRAKTSLLEGNPVHCPHGNIKEQSDCGKPRYTSGLATPPFSLVQACNPGDRLRYLLDDRLLREMPTLPLESGHLPSMGGQILRRK
jgi:hypothetical protein